MRKVIILSGVSGSGKSTIAKAVAHLADAVPDISVCIVSADSYFSHNGEYRFDASKLSEAHGQCFKKFIQYLDDPWTADTIVIVDNTNTTEIEIAPYMLAAQAYGFDAEIQTIVPDPFRCNVDAYCLKCAARNVHGVPVNTISQQYARILTRKLPPWWKESRFTGPGFEGE